MEHAELTGKKRVHQNPGQRGCGRPAAGAEVPPTPVVVEWEAGSPRIIQVSRLLVPPAQGRGPLSKPLPQPFEGVIRVREQKEMIRAADNPRLCGRRELAHLGHTADKVA